MKQEIKLSLAKACPSWIRLGLQALVLAIGLLYLYYPNPYSVFALVGIAGSLVSLAYVFYNQFVVYYNGIQVSRLDPDSWVSHAIKHEDGTFQDKNGLIKEDADENQEPKDTNGE